MTSSKDKLQFHDSSQDDVLYDRTDGQTHTFTNFPTSAMSDEEEGEEEDKSQLLKEKKAPSFWTFEYYQQFFDVDTHQVFGRVLGSMTPLPNRNYLKSQIRPNPDLYDSVDQEMFPQNLGSILSNTPSGAKITITMWILPWLIEPDYKIPAMHHLLDAGPFWICTTLVFTTAIAGNMANYLSLGGKEYTWRYDFHKVTIAASAIFSYWWLVPALLYGLLWYRKSEAGYTFMEILCLYGYSLAIYIPISILWVINITWLRWCLVVAGAVTSGGVLVFTIWPAVRDETKHIAYVVISLVFLFHLLLAAGFVLYFFHVPPITPSSPAAEITTQVAPAVVNASKVNMVKDNTFKSQNPPKAQSLLQNVKEDFKGGKEALDTQQGVENVKKVNQKAENVEKTPENKVNVEIPSADKGKNGSINKEKDVLPKRQDVDLNDENDLARINEKTKVEGSNNVAGRIVKKGIQI